MDHRLLHPQQLVRPLEHIPRERAIERRARRHRRLRCRAQRSAQRRRGDVGRIRRVAGAGAGAVAVGAVLVLVDGVLVVDMRRCGVGGGLGGVGVAREVLPGGGFDVAAGLGEGFLQRVDVLEEVGGDELEELGVADAAHELLEGEEELAAEAPEVPGVPDVGLVQLDGREALLQRGAGFEADVAAADEGGPEEVDALRGEGHVRHVEAAGELLETDRDDSLALFDAAREGDEDLFEKCFLLGAFRDLGRVLDVLTQGAVAAGAQLGSPVAGKHERFPRSWGIGN